ncbi:EF-hand domain-containing protein [Sphingomonas sp.]|jgi:Ca2+-binding EF-hand superfamily protein|uniref:EF-hand domain-containing protein n=1 Tax=Sphingomonas sp. TaxID=28214 RepID=UPI00183355E5|nr:EF-hand domain-containing protein [Sphingomonas sp.]MBA3512623.1 EF-hand domain-containing protein [Sphingomonas sp.]
MRLILVAAAGHILLFGAVPAASQTTSAPPRTAAQTRQPTPVPRAQFIADMDAQFKTLDGNGDRVVLRAEIETAQKRQAAAASLQRNRMLFEQLDKDRNGQLSAAEFRALATIQGKPDAAPLLSRFDTNKDGKIELVEYRAATQANFDRMDTDRDGIVSVAEMRAGGIIK